MAGVIETQSVCGKSRPLGFRQSTSWGLSPCRRGWGKKTKSLVRPITAKLDIPTMTAVAAYRGVAPPRGRSGGAPAGGSVLSQAVYQVRVIPNRTRSRSSASWKLVPRAK